MNLVICLQKCERSLLGGTLRIFRAGDEWCLGPMGRQDFPEERCGCGAYALIQEPSAFLGPLPPAGWKRDDRWGAVKDGETPTSFAYYGADGRRLEASLWDVHLHPKCGCPFLAEHFLADIRHEDRIRKWTKWKTDMERRKNGKADGEKLP